jgi:PST family polysaccharide transporter
MQRIVRNVGWKTLAVAVEKALRLVLVALVARVLGTAAYGQYTYAVALATLCVQATDLGLGLFLAREFAQRGTADARLLHEVLAAKLGLSAAYLAAMAVAAGLHARDPWLALTVALAAVSNLAVNTQETLCQVFRGMQRLDLEARATSVLAAAQLGTAAAGLGAWWLAGMPFGASGAMGTVAAMALVAAVLASGYTLRLVQTVVPLGLHWSSATLRRFVREVLPLGVAIVASLVYFKIDVPMLRWLTDDTEVGTYNAAYKLLEVSALVPGTLMAATFPALSAALVERPQEAVRLHRMAFLLLFGAGVLGLLALAGIPDWIIQLLYGSAFGASVPVLVALAPSVLLTFVNYLETHMLVALGRVRAQMAVAVSLIFVNVGANFLLIPRYGGVGAALATALTELCLLVAVVPLVRKGLREHVQRGHS